MREVSPQFWIFINFGEIIYSIYWWLFCWPAYLPTIYHQFLKFLVFNIVHYRNIIVNSATNKFFHDVLSIV